MAVTGRGDFALRSAWLARGRGRGKVHLLTKTFAVEDATNAQPAIWRDWFFEAAAGGPTVVSVSAAALAPLGQAVKVNRTWPVSAVAITLPGQSITLNARRIVVTTVPTISLAVQSLAVNARTLIATSQASIALLGQSIAVSNFAANSRRLWNRIRIGF